MRSACCSSGRSGVVKVGEVNSVNIRGVTPPRPSDPPPECNPQLSRMAEVIERDRHARRMRVLEDVEAHDAGMKAARRMGADNPRLWVYAQIESCRSGSLLVMRATWKK